MFQIIKIYEPYSTLSSNGSRQMAQRFVFAGCCCLDSSDVVDSLSLNVDSVLENLCEAFSASSARRARIGAI